MDDNQNRRHQMFVRVREFIQQRVDDFSETGVARLLFTELKVTITEVEQLASTQVTGVGQARHGTQTRGEARAALQDDIEAIFRVGRWVSRINFNGPCETMTSLWSMQRTRTRQMHCR